jgi:hypothetical protein
MLVVGAQNFNRLHWLTDAVRQAKHDGRQDAAIDAAKETARAIQKRADIDEETIKLDARGVCLELGGLQSDCEQLRGLEADKR